MSTDERNALRTRLHNYGQANWVGRSTTTPNDMLRIAQACVEALDQFDTYETEVASWKAVAYDHSERLKKLDKPYHEREAPHCSTCECGADDVGDKP